MPVPFDRSGEEMRRSVTSDCEHNHQEQSKVTSRPQPPYTLSTSSPSHGASTIQLGMSTQADTNRERERINPQDDPRDSSIGSPNSPSARNDDDDDDDNNDDEDDALRHHPLRNHNPWRHGPQGSEEDIDHVAFSPAPGVRFERTFIRSVGARSNQQGPNPNDDVIGSLFQAFGGLLQGGNNQNSPGDQPRTRGVVITTGPQIATQSPYPGPNNYNRSHVHGAWGPTPPGAGRHTYTAEARIFPRDLPGGNADPMNNFHTVMQTLFASMQANAQEDTAPRVPGSGPGGGAAGLSLPDLLRQALDPANAVHGDAVFTQEAFDRIVGQMMEQNGASSAPGPASAAAIAALPKKTVEKSMMGSDGTAECSVCMENVSVGDEVTVLPCNHWFHEQCVGIWLKEHDTCPHCRKGIMPARGEPDTPRSPNRTPRNNPLPFGLPRATANPQAVPTHTPFTQPGMQHPYVPGGYPAYPEPQQFVQSSSQPQGSSSSQLHGRGLPSHSAHTSGWRLQREPSGRSSASSRENTNSEGNPPSGSGGVAGWFRNLRGGSRSSGS
ncbi:MAG: hypothetical protein Q9163_003129 [Psora crenata]